MSAHAAIDIGGIAALSIRPAGTRASLSVDSVRVRAACGLEGDKHADPFSPRQLLLTDVAVYEDLSLPAHALGENLLVTADTSRLRSGSVLRIGDEVLLRLMFQCEPCGTLDGFQAGLAGRIGARRGMLARVLASGVIHRGDRILEVDWKLPAWDDDWRERVAQVLRAVPDGMVLTYARLALLAGVQSTYCRAFPRLLKTLGLMHRAVPAQAARGLDCWDGDGLFGDAAYSICSS